MIKYLKKFLYVYPSNNISLVYWISIFITLSLLEILGISTIIPFITVAGDPQNISNNDILNKIYITLGFANTRHYIIFLGICFLIVFSIKSLATWYIQSQIFKFSFLQKEKLIKKLMYGYVEAPYSLFISKNNAQIIHNIIDQTQAYSDRILSTFLNTGANLFSITALSILLCISSPIAILCLMILSLPLLLLFMLFKQQIRFWGKELFVAGQGIIVNINNGLGGFKETRILGCGPYFAEQTVGHARVLANSSAKFYAFKLAPRFITEILLVFFLVGFISLQLFLGKNLQQFAPILGVFALGSLRLMPAFNGIFGGLTVLRNSSHALDKLYIELKELDNFKEQNNDSYFTSNKFDKLSHLKSIDCQTKTVEKTIFSNQIVLDRVNYKYTNAINSSLDRISLSIKKGNSIGLIGKSGAGKTTLVDVILGLLTPQQGDIKVDDCSIYRNLRGWQNLIGYIPQSIFLIDDTVERNIAFGLPDYLIDRQKLEKAIKLAHLSEVIEDLPHGIKTRIGERGVMMSGGQRQRIGIARALYHEREILVLDEATSALDNETEKLVSEAIRSLSGMKTMIIIAHRLSTIEHCDCIYVMDKGRIVNSGSYQEVVVEN